MPVRQLDYSALTEPVQRADIAAWRAQARASGAVWARGTLSVGSAVGAGLFALVFVFVFGGLFTSFVTEGIRNGNPIGVVFPSIFIAPGVGRIAIPWFSVGVASASPISPCWASTKRVRIPR